MAQEDLQCEAVWGAFLGAASKAVSDQAGGNDHALAEKIAQNHQGIS